MEHQITKEEKFESIYRTYETDVYRLCLFFTKDEHTAKDLSQRAFFEFYRRMDHINPDSARAYLFRTVRNMTYNLTRDNKHRMQEEELAILDELNHSSMSVEDLYIRRERENEVSRFYDGIMERLRQKNLSWYEAMDKVYRMKIPQEEVARELGVSQEVLYSRLRRAKDWVRKNYKEEYKKISR